MEQRVSRVGGRVATWRWPVALALMALGAAVTAAAWGDILHIAMTDEEASQIWLVPVIIAWLIWARRDALRGLTATSSWLGVFVIAAGWGFSTWGFDQDIEVLWQFAAVLTVVGGLLTVFGLDIVKRLWPAFLVLGFLVPVPANLRTEMALPLQNMAAGSAAFVLNLLGASVQQSGNTLIYHGQEVLIAEACNGMRMVFSLILVTCAFAFAMPLRTPMRLLLIGLSPLAALVCNVIRLVPTVWVYGHFSKDTAGKFHDLTGWAMLFVAFLLLIGVIKLLQWAQVPVMQPRPPRENHANVPPMEGTPA